MESLKIEDYGVIKDLEIKNLKKINVFSGKIGEGIRSFMLFVKHKDRLVIQEDIESELHHSEMRQRWLNIINNKRQIFVSTQSYEMLQKLVELCEDEIIKENDVMFYSFQIRDGKNYVSTYDGPKLARIIEAGGEVR